VCVCALAHVHVCEREREMGGLGLVWIGLDWIG
jgi:hypothetical protein